jgi:outer membrane protein assembly factor BamB
MVIGTEEPGAVLALDATDGRHIWSHSLPAQSLRQPLAAFGGVLVRLSETLVLLRRSDGTPLATWAWTGQLVGDVATGEGVAFAVRCEKEDSIGQGKRTTIPRECRVVRLSPDGSTLWTLDSVVRGPRLLWDERRAVLWEASGALNICDPETGRRTHQMSLPDVLLHLTPVVEEDRIYVATADGELIALASPVAPPTDLV